MGGVIAARLVWMLRVTGHDAALLDGGLAAYGGALETGPAPAADPPATHPPSFTPRPWPAERLADVNDATHPGNVVLDARSPDRYRGETETVDARAGHIPGARSLPCRENLDPAGLFLPVADFAAASYRPGLPPAPRSCRTAVQGSPRATTCWLSSWPDYPRGGCTPAHGRNTATLATTRWRPDRADRGPAPATRGRGPGQ